MHTISRRAGVSVNAIRLWFEARNRKKTTSKSSDELHWSDVDVGYDLGGLEDDEDDAPKDEAVDVAATPTVGVVSPPSRPVQTPKQKPSAPAQRERLTLKTTQADVLRTWLYNNKANPTLGEEDVEELIAKTKLSKEEIQRWLTFALKKGVQDRLATVWRRKGDKIVQSERVSYFRF